MVVLKIKFDCLKYKSIVLFWDRGIIERGVFLVFNGKKNIKFEKR